MMRKIFLLAYIAFLLVGPSALAGFRQRRKLVINEQTQEGIFLQLIQSENDQSKRVVLLERFLLQFPNFESIDWVYANLQLDYLQIGNFDKALAFGEKLLGIDGDDLESAELNVKAAEGKKDPALVRKWTDRMTKVAESVVHSPQPTAPDELEAWRERVEFARKLVNYQEHTLYRRAFETTDLKLRLDLLDQLSRQNPKTPYMNDMQLLYFNTYRALGDTRRAFAVGEKILERDQSHEDILLVVADAYFRQGTEPRKVLQYSELIIERMRTKAKPAGMSEAEWTRQKNTFTGIAYGMIGNIYLKQEQHALADKVLRAALPLSRDSDQRLAAVLSSLGWANYKLKNYAEATRFYQQCIAINSPYQEHAIRNLGVIQSEQAGGRPANPATPPAPR